DNDLQRSIAYDNMGTDYINLKDFENAIDCLYKALEIRKKRDSGLELSRSYSSLGGVYLDLLNEGINWNGLSNKELLDSARINYEKALPLARIHEDRYGETTILKGLGDVNKLLGNKDKAVTFYQQSAELAKTLGGYEEIKMVTRNLARLKADKGDFKSAYYWLDQYINAKDSLYNEDKARELTKMDMQYTFDKEKALEQTEHKHELETQQAIAEANKKKQTVVILLVSAGLLIVLVFSFFLYKRFKVTQRQKNTIEEQKQEVEHQKTLVEEKNQEIMDSIQYAKRIQSAILPPDKLVKEYLQNSFILYKPKDIVAGDFYWMEHVEDTVLFSAADCTGHGVPGAMVSVVCNNGLNRSVREFNLKEPGKILDKTREIVVQEFEKSEEDVKDGMDIALCSLRMRNENEDNTDSQSAFHSTLQYAGAHNPLWIIRKGEVNEDDLNLKYPGRVKVEKFNDGYTLIEIRADKQPIGKYDNPVPFTTFTINLEKNDSFYIFSDGFSDQFGGDKGKKFKAKNFKELLVSVQGESMKDQKIKIDSAFEEWRGSLEQLDDVCVIGVRI
ncbi:MAG: SpoIIE family protein phosphatase, partial [Crocinitomicaceae bacterium]|nr:SpoIIE family protein phosphatase [Crocinitomicaceae bacterium]